MLNKSIVVTGAQGFIGKNLCLMLAEKGYSNVVGIDKDTNESELMSALEAADFVYHLAGVNRPKDEDEYQEGNANLTRIILSALERFGNLTPVMISSSIQAESENPYGKSKADAENLLKNYGKDSGAEHYIYRFPNVFGKWCRPNYNSFVATFCYNIANGIDINVNDPAAPVTLVYIDDVCNELIALLDGSKNSGFRKVEPEYPTTVGEVAGLLKKFNESRNTLVTESVGKGLTRALYSTYLSYFEPSHFSYMIPSYSDERGIFCEMLKTKNSGQFSFFTALPGITRGGHYHHSKNEKFLVIKGNALFKFEHIVSGERYELLTNGDSPQIVETVPGWTHDVTNIGDEELVVMLWANEVFDRENPDTFVRAL